MAMNRSGEPAGGRLWQSVALLLSMGLAVVMILNTQMGGEAMWFWYGNVFRHGAKLYSTLHFALQPFFVLETATWQRLFGERIAIDEIPALVHAFLLAFGLYLVLRESRWPDWQKAVILFGSFVFIVAGHSYRFDDYHVLAEAYMVYALVVLLRIGRPGRPEDPRRDLLWVATLGLICGIAMVTRITDGVALLISSVIGIVFLVRRGKIVSLLLLMTVAGLVTVVTVKLTGDTISAWSSSSIFHAAASKGGAGSIFAAPFLVIRQSIRLLLARKRMLLFFVLAVGAAVLINRYWRGGRRYIIPVQFALAALLYLMADRYNRYDLRRSLFFEYLVLLLTLGMYLLAAGVIFRFVRARQGRGTWDPREVLLVLPMLEWASYSASAAADPLMNYYAPVALLVLLFPVLQPFPRWAAWLNPTVVAVMALVAISGISGKILEPYSWQNYRYAGMFHNRVWYHHPVFGEMYIDRDLLRVSQRICADIGAQPGRSAPELLSLPYPYPNYFCDTAPWHDYVQTFFDTATRPQIEHLMGELQTHPPEWIVYQRQLNIMEGAERLYNHGHPLAQRELDAMLMRKIASGQWVLTDHFDYLTPDKVDPRETGWFVIRTRPEQVAAGDSRAKQVEPGMPSAAARTR